jgi:hypothetical protein
MSEAELHVLHGRLEAGKRIKAQRGELFSHDGASGRDTEKNKEFIRRAYEGGCLLSTGTELAPG